MERSSRGVCLYSSAPESDPGQTVPGPGNIPGFCVAWRRGRRHCFLLASRIYLQRGTWACSLPQVKLHVGSCCPCTSGLSRVFCYQFHEISIKVSDHLTLILLTWRIWWDPNNASKLQMGFNSAFKGLSTHLKQIILCYRMDVDNLFVLPLVSPV